MSSVGKWVGAAVIAMVGIVFFFYVLPSIFGYLLIFLAIVGAVALVRFILAQKQPMKLSSPSAKPHVAERKARRELQELERRIRR